jgi:CheY-like chemotaxis protein
MQGGSVQVHSAGAGKGSEFVVRLPRAASQRPSAQIAEVPTAASAAPAPGLRVLVVDDHPDAAESLAALLQGAGYQAAVAHDGPAAIAVATRLRPDVVLLDIGLPGMNGFEVARALKEAPETRSCVLIAVSGYGQTEDHQRSREVGFDHHLVKPADFVELERILDCVRREPRLPDALAALPDSPFPAPVRLRASS